MRSLLSTLRSCSIGSNDQIGSRLIDIDEQHCHSSLTSSWKLVTIVRLISKASLSFGNEASSSFTEERDSIKAPSSRRAFALVIKSCRCCCCCCLRIRSCSSFLLRSASSSFLLRSASCFLFRSCSSFLLHSSSSFLLRSASSLPASRLRCCHRRERNGIAQK